MCTLMQPGLLWVIHWEEGWGKGDERRQKGKHSNQSEQHRIELTNLTNQLLLTLLGQCCNAALAGCTSDDETRRAKNMSNCMFLIWWDRPVQTAEDGSRSGAGRKNGEIEDEMAKGFEKIAVRLCFCTNSI